MRDRQLIANGWSIEARASALRPFVSRAVISRTQLAGMYDFKLTWTPETLPQFVPDAPALAIDPNGPSIVTPVQEQLGLKLESTRAPVDVVVVDHMERPTWD